jgi:uncharacterized SAM-binding protein YcdF (DUF218 family)
VSNAGWLVTNAISAFLVPPGSLLLAAGLGALLGWRWPRAGRVLIGLSLAALYVLATPLAGKTLLAALEPAPRDPLARGDGEAIVVLGGGTYFAAPEYGGDTVNPATLVRLRYAAHLHRALDRPVLVTGGAPTGSAVPEAVQMKQTLETDFRVPVRWVEPRSINTLENARLSRQLLAASGIRRIYLVTHAWHMPRAQRAFESAGFDVIPAATAYTTRSGPGVLDFLPSADALRESRQFFHEAIGMGWYHLRLLPGR